MTYRSKSVIFHRLPECIVSPVLTSISWLVYLQICWLNTLFFIPYGCVDANVWCPDYHGNFRDIGCKSQVYWSHHFFSMFVPWNPHFSMVNPRKSPIFPWNLHEISMKSPIFHSFFPWNLHALNHHATTPQPAGSSLASSASGSSSAAGIFTAPTLEIDGGDFGERRNGENTIDRYIYIYTYVYIYITQRIDIFWRNWVGILSFYNGILQSMVYLFKKWELINIYILQRAKCTGDRHFFGPIAQGLRRFETWHLPNAHGVYHLAIWMWKGCSWPFWCLELHNIHVCNVSVEMSIPISSV